MISVPPIIVNTIVLSLLTVTYSTRLPQSASSNSDTASGSFSSSSMKRSKDYLKVNNGNANLECTNCGEDIEPGDEYFEQEDGSVLCPGCFDFAYPKCEFCGKRVSEDDIMFWGDCHCCPECYEGFNPTFDSEENERDTIVSSLCLYPKNQLVSLL